MCCVININDFRQDEKNVIPFGVHRESYTFEDMIFSKAGEYGIRAAVFIASCSIGNERASLKDIAREIDSPEAFTAKILQLLVHAGIMDSTRGPAGGFHCSTRQMKKTRLLDIVCAIDGAMSETHCVLGLKKCSEVNPCPVHHKFKQIKSDILRMLSSTTLYEMSMSTADGLAFLKME